ncbi:hypothetical protein BO85DRAFT_452164 [Aspergillus piperis CBS 112811]|uniref:Uncharacterized protein n=1 Tax=Aspergillus piperis CBS 112811 TaxID=1448313 RepID=A0A8G1QW49_9EURO|nr:hypothetical protein BO85DRAFT_452164 [Aspergillus piperis CBS 112811]RAH54738.1 hypothetical protein BO85DRAFT_452164 [Aspergillus piperis CBS 112811]
MSDAALNSNGIKSIKFRLGRIATSDVYIATAYFTIILTSISLQSNRLLTHTDT